MSAEKPEIGDVWENDYFRPYNPFYILGYYRQTRIKQQVFKILTRCNN